MAIGKTFIQILGPNEPFPNNPGFSTIFLQKQEDVNRSVFGFNDGDGNTYSAFLCLAKGTVSGNTLSKIADVSIDNPNNGAPFVYNSTTQKWGNSPNNYRVVGDYFDIETSGLTSLSGFTVISPNSVWAVSGGTIRTSRGDGAAGFSDYANYNSFGYINSKYWSASFDFYIRRTDATSYGIGFGFTGATVNSGADNLRVDFNCATGTIGTLTLRINGAAVGSGAVKLTASNNEKIKITITRNLRDISAMCQNFTSINTVTPVVVDTTIISRATSTNWDVSSVIPHIYNLGGVYDITNITINSKNTSSADIMVIGDSISHGMFLSPYDKTYSQIIEEITGKKVLNFASTSTITADWVNSLNEILVTNPKKVYFLLGRNDVATSVPQATTLANIATIVNALVAAGIDYRIISLLPSSASLNTAITNLNTQFATLYPTKYLNIQSFLNDGNGNIKSKYNSGDGTHLSSLGQIEVAKRLIAADTNLQV